MEIRRLFADEFEAHLATLAEILLDAVDSGSSVSFIEPFELEAARQFWSNLSPQVYEQSVLVLGAWHESELVGTVQLRPALQPNQPHRADVAKLLVHRRARGLGIGRRLMEAIEPLALERGCSLLTLDTVPGSIGARLYSSLGYIQVGIIPGYALMPNGELCDTCIYYKWLTRT